MCWNTLYGALLHWSVSLGAGVLGCCPITCLHQSMVVQLQARSQQGLLQGLLLQEMLPELIKIAQVKLCLQPCR